MKVLVISAAFPPFRAGESEHALHLCSRLADQGLELHLLTTRGGRIAPGLAFTVWPIMRDWSWLDLPRLARFLKRCAPDAVLLMYSGWLYNDHPMITFAPTLARRLLPNVRFVTQMEIGTGSTWHGIGVRAARKAAQHWVGSRGVDYAFGTLLRDCHQLIVLSELHLAFFSSRLPGVEERSLLIPPPPLMKISARGPATRARGRTLLGATGREFLLVFFGYADRSKGIETLFRAVELVTRHDRQARLVMVGGAREMAGGPSSRFGQDIDRHEQEMRAFAGEIGIGEKVVWTSGYSWNSDEGSTLLRAADAAVLPFEGGVTLNRSSLAAVAAHELPIVTTRGAQVESPFRDRENVLLCPPRDVEPLAAAIQSLIDDSALRERLSLGAAKLAGEWFSWERAVERTMLALQGGEDAPLRT